MFDPATGFGAGATALFFPVGQWFAAHPFVVNPAAVTLVFKMGFDSFGSIGTVSPHIPDGVAAIEQDVQGLGVVDAGIGDLVFAHQLVRVVDVEVVLIA
ncbi:hypothetical protein A1342_00380 [Methylomonas methanica]|uniref:Uncharacterized protein n=1 Tax=Methylomonas denitrificans TaxID=1538553 RepID=A0A140E734_9GAMM|nr:hypothetical protein JT25_022440 [Methylomonas denitrificans]OAH98162.1 hypothetical protein A1342_00380 [Methylomonas methanica]